MSEENLTPLQWRERMKAGDEPVHKFIALWVEVSEERDSALARLEVAKKALNEIEVGIAFGSMTPFGCGDKAREALKEIEGGTNGTQPQTSLEIGEANTTPDQPDVCTGLRAEIDAAERRIEELESELERASKDAEYGKRIMRSLIKYMDMAEYPEGDIRLGREWAGGPPEPDL